MSIEKIKTPKKRIVLVFNTDDEQIFLLKDEVSHFRIFKGTEDNKSSLKVTMKNGEAFNFINLESKVIDTFIDEFVDNS